MWRLRQLPRPKVRGLRLRKKSCRVWPVDLRVTNSQSFTGLPQLDSTCLTRRLNVVTWTTKSKHPSSLLNIMPRETIDPRSPSFSGRSRVPYLFRGVNLFPVLARELRGDWPETIFNRSTRNESNLSRGTIHPHPEGCGLLYPLTPRDKCNVRSHGVRKQALAKQYLRYY
jgi:hypothetical protein